jgi:NitT/TauT family transport system substrate-binding protein
MNVISHGAYAARYLISLAMGALVLLICLPACTPAAPVQQLIIRVGTLAAPDSLPYYVILERGLDKKYGLQLVETPFPGGAAIIDALAADKLDVGVNVGTIPVFAAAQRDLIPGTIVPAAALDFADPEHPSIGVLVPPSVNNWKDLEGQTIAVNSVNSLNTASLKGRMQLEGIRDYKLTEIAFSNMGLSVADGNIGAATMVEPYLTQSLQRKDGKLLDWVIGRPPMANIEYAMIVFSSAFYKSNPATVKAYLRAHLEAVNWIERNPDEARAILSRVRTIPLEVMNNIVMQRWSLDGRNDKVLLEDIQPLLINVGVLKEPIPVSRLYDETLLNEILAESR